MKVTLKVHNALPEADRMVHVDHVFIGILRHWGGNEWKFIWSGHRQRNYSEGQQVDIAGHLEKLKAVLIIKNKLRA